MGRFSDDIPLKPRGSAQPTTVPILLRRLHVKDAPFEKQSEAVREWLEQNKPGPTMRHSLERHGFGGLLRGQISLP
ncbi:MAG: hypothetical protein U1D00_16305 [Mycobacterium sp.]|nr:hypothetical protein [Mycobacterium sp.]